MMGENRRREKPRMTANQDGEEEIRPKRETAAVKIPDLSSPCRPLGSG